MHKRNIYNTVKVPTDTAGNDTKTWRWIKFQLGMRDMSLADVARSAGVRRHTLYAARNSAYPGMESIIAEALETHPSKIWPHRYTADGSHTAGYMNLRKARTKSAHSKECSQGSRPSVRATSRKVNVNRGVVA